jgi:hypothetical protein
VAGVSITTVKNTLRAARGLKLVTIEERRLTAFRNAPNVVRIVDPSWRAWLRLGGGGKSVPRSHTQLKNQRQHSGTGLGLPKGREPRRCACTPATHTSPHGVVSRLARSKTLVRSLPSSRRQQRRKQRCSVFASSASEPPAVQCSVVEEHAKGVVHLHGVVIATRDLTGQFRLSVIKTGPGGMANLSQGGTFSADANRQVRVGQSTISLELGAEFTASLEIEAGGQTYKCRAGSERT